MLMSLKWHERNNILCHENDLFSFIIKIGSTDFTFTPVSKSADEYENLLKAIQNNTSYVHESTLIELINKLKLPQSN
jgi:hypothetical protein